MRLLLHSSSFYVIGAIILIGIALFLLVGAVKKDKEVYITATVERGDVAELVSVSGVVEAENTAELAFPVTGIVTEVFVDEGSIVQRDETLATLASATLVAERLDAVAALQSAIATRDELIAGPRSEARSVTSQTVANAEANLATVIAKENEKVENARRTLLSSSLATRTTDPNETATAPTVTGTYTCETEGTYTLDVYNSASKTEYSFRLSGLESGTYTAFTDGPGAFGDCGLFAQFDDTASYNFSNWIIEIPNKRSSVYQTNRNAYELARTTRETAIENAENTLALARQEATLENADPRSEELDRAEAAVTQARARIAIIDAQIADRSIVAPYDGVVTDVSILRGETATAEPVITLLASGAFDLTARIPEIDITKVNEGQKAEVIFDANRDELVVGTVNFISPLALEIDGVAYFEATIGFDDVPPWLKSGLNADIEIIVGEAIGVLRVPKRFVDMSDAEPTVLLQEGEQTVATPVSVGFVGNDGFVEITDLAEGTEVIAP